MSTSRALAAAMALALLLACEPIGPIAGGQLSGDVVPWPDDWGFTADVDTVEVETRPEDPYSVTVWCLGVEDRLYVPTLDPDDRRWVRNLRAHPEARVRVEGKLYEVRRVEVDDPVEFETVSQALIAKYDIDDPEEKEGDVVIFRLEPR